MKAIKRDEKEMKESNIEWIGNIPSWWKITKVRNVIQHGKNGIKIGPFGSALTNKTTGDAEYKIYGQANLVSGYFFDTKNKITEETFQELQNYEIIPGDICISMMGTIGKCLTVPATISKGIMDSHLIKIRLSEMMDNRYFEYVYDKDKGGICFTQMQYEKKGSIMDGLNTTIVKGLYLPLPEINEQETIADYLDERCAKINIIIAEVKAMIEEYKELKQAKIKSVILGGLHSREEKKDRGISWFGKIPKHWRIGKVKYGTSKVGSGKTPRGGAEVYSTEGILFLRSQNIYNEGLKLDNPYFISEEIDEDMKNTRVEPNDVLLNITGGSIGRCCVYPEAVGQANVNQHVSIIRVKPDVFRSKYMHLFWISPVGQTAIDRRIVKLSATPLKNRLHMVFCNQGTS